MVAAIASDKTILIANQPKVGNVNVDDHGGGITGEVGGKIAVVISDKVLNTTDAKGNPLTDLPADILAHEIAGAVPQALGNPNANSITIDNQIRSEKHEPQLAPDPKHKAYDP